MEKNSAFRAYYQNSLLPVLSTIEADRRKIAKAVYIFVFVIVVVIAVNVGIFFLAAHDSGSNNFGSFILGSFLFVGLGTFLFFKFWVSFKARNLKNHFKTEVISKMVKFVDQSLTYSPTAGIPQSVYHQSNIYLERVDAYHCEDLISGTFGSTAIRFSEVHSQRKERRGNKNETHWVTSFKGIFFVADFNKNFNGRTVVLTDSAESLFGSFGTMLQKMNKMRDSLVKLEDPEFEKAFAVYSTDAVEANYILSPALMQRILAFKSKSGRIQLSFINSNVFVTIPLTKNLFEAPLFSSVINFDRLEKYHDYLQLVTGIVADLNLNNRVWTKE